MNRKLWKQAYKRLSMYGDTTPLACWSRLASEEAALQGTNAIQGFAVLGKIAEEARLHKSIILAVGALNSSYAAWLFGGTLVNPLQPHYYCPTCGNVEFVPGVASGFDLPPKKCACGSEYLRDGHNIPYEGYARAEQYGTVVKLRVPKGFKPIAIKTIMNFYRDIAEVLPVLIEDDIAGGGFEMYVVLPPAKNKPPVSEDGFWHAGMEEYLNWLEDETVYMIGSHEKLNELHDMKAADNLVCPNHQDIITMDMATALYQKRRESTAYITDFISDTETIDFDLLIRIDSLSHSTDAWLTNGEALVKNGEANFREVPASREDIWTAIAEALDKRGIHDYSLALQVMDDSRTGVYFSRGLPKNLEKYLLSLELPRWFPCYLKQVKYLSPKGHCVALLIVDLMYEWYALHSCQHRTPTVQG